MPESKQTMQTFISHIAWESEVWMQVLSAAKNNMVATPGQLAA